MSILIPTEIMPMPKSCVKCIFMALSMCHTIPRLMDKEMASELYHGRHKKCPLIEVENEVNHGRWDVDSDNLPICSECGEIALQRVFIKIPQLIQDVQMVRSNYCPHCGAKMDLR